MQTCSITLHGPGEIVSPVDTGEAQFFIGTETASDVFTVQADGIMPRHAWVWISEAGLQVEDLGGGTLVNGHEIHERVQVDYPASVQMGELTLVIEVKAVQPGAVSPTPSSLEVTIPLRAVTKSSASGEQANPQRTPTRGNVQKNAATGTPDVLSTHANKAPHVGEYTLVREIARGGMGQIYFGEDPQLERQVAVKVSSISEGGEDPRFSKEAKVLAQLAHPNIVPIYNIGVDAQSRPFYSMKLIKGRTLQAVLNEIREGNASAIKDYPRATLLTIFRKICDAMMFAHSKGILHRDLKPENIMVGEYGEVLVMDWGLAKVLGEQENASAGGLKVKDTGDYGMTMEGEVMGTPQYMSPEQAEGMVAELDARSDIYSLGGILYAILTLLPPVEGRTLNEVLTKVKRGEISSMTNKRGGKKDVAVGTPAAMGVDVPEALQAVTLKAMATHRNHRYPSVEAFAADIEAYQNGFATSAENAGTLRQFVLFVKRNKGVAAAVALFAMAAVVFVVKLAASERRALVEMEKSRKEAAQSQIVLAESAFAQCDAGQMRMALSKVPADLRTQVWHYLNERTVGGDVGILPERDTTWMGLEPNPLQAGSFFSIRSDGAFCKIEGLTGAVSVLWKADVSVERMGQFSVSKDGVSTAFVAKEKTPQGERQIQIRQVSDGRLIRTCVLPKERQVFARLWVSQDYLLAQTHNPANQESFFTAWAVADGRLLWETADQGWRTFASFNENPKEICLFTGTGHLLKIDADTGKGLTRSKNRIGITANRWENYDGGKEWTKFALCTGGAGQVRVYSNAWIDQIQTEFVSSKPVSALAFLPDTDLLLAVCTASEQAGCLEVRDCSQGARLIRSLPFTNAKIKWDAVNSLRCSGPVAAFLLPNHIRIWNFSESVPVRASTHLRGNGLAGDVLSVNGYEVLGYRKNSKANNKVDEICLFDTREGWDAPRETGKLLVSSFKAGREPELAGGLADLSLEIQFDRDGKRALFQGVITSLALNIQSGELKGAWSEEKRLLPYASSRQRMLIHPDADLLWTGDSVVQFSTAAELKRINRGRFKGYNRSSQRRAAWIGTTRVVEECKAGSNPEGNADEPDSNWIVLWDTETGEVVAEEQSSNGQCLSVSPDGSRIAEGCTDNRVRFRNPKTLAVEREMRVHESEVRNIDWHPTLPIFATVGVNEVRFWDFKEGRMLEEIRLKTEVRSVRFVGNGRQVHIQGGGLGMLFEPKSCAP